jgi:hypothetical protein
MEFITVKELAHWLATQGGLWDQEDLILAFKRLAMLHTYLNSQPFFELDTKQGDKLIEDWLASERILCQVFC